jgi:Protein of unknown function (DUF4058)
MPSPFPGMNPFIEQAAVWNDFHHSFIVELRKALVPLVPGYFMRIEEQLYVHEPPAESRRPSMTEPHMGALSTSAIPNRDFQRTTRRGPINF